LSGILNTQADDVLDVYTRLGFTLKKHTEVGEWSTLVLHNPVL
jgi:ribosomal protein L11 methyltransferase